MTLSDLLECVGERGSPDHKWLARVVGCEDSIAEKAVREIKVELDFEKEICESLRSSGRRYYAQFPAPAELYALVRLLKPQYVLESGVSSGISSAHILMALKRNSNRGKLYSMDLPVIQKSKKRRAGTASWSIPYGKSSGWAVPDALKANWELLLGRSEDILPDLLRRLGTVDLFCHDSPASAKHLAFEIENISKYLVPGSALIADNAGMNMSAVKRAARNLNSHVYPRKHSGLVAFRIPFETND